MATTTLTRLAEKVLPALSGASVTYNPEKNVYLTLGYTSAAGNTDFKAVRFSDRRLFITTLAKDMPTRSSMESHSSPGMAIKRSSLAKRCGVAVATGFVSVSVLPWSRQSRC